MFPPYAVVSSIIEDRLRAAEHERRARLARTYRSPATRRRASRRRHDARWVGDRP
jgi:hypothetical protein